MMGKWKSKLLKLQNKSKENENKIANEPLN